MTDEEYQKEARALAALRLGVRDMQTMPGPVAYYEVIQVRAPWWKRLFGIRFEEQLFRVIR
jgi:hypothetical protein